MFRFCDISLERKLKLITMVATGTALLIAGIGIVTYDFISFRKLMARDLAVLAELTSQYCVLPLGLDYKKDGTEALGALAAENHIVAACVYDKNGREFARYVRSAAEGPFTPPPVGRPGHEISSDRLRLFRPIFDDEQIIGTIYLESDLAKSKTRLHAYTASVLLMLLAALAVASVLSSKLQKIISGPLLKLAEAARTVSREKNYSLRVPRTSSDELGSLIGGFNEMLGQIQQRDDALLHAQNELEKRVQERTHELEQEISERKLAEQVIHQQLTRISLLNRITHAISERQDVQSILSIVLQQLEQHLPVCSGAFYLFDPGTETLLLAAVRTGASLDDPGMFKRQVPFSSNQSAELRNCACGVNVYLPDSRETRPVFLQEGAVASIQSAVMVPLMVESKLFGLLITGRDSANAFSSGECEFLKMLCEQVALAGHHAQLYTQLQAAYDELRQTQQRVMQHERLRALGQMASGIAHDVNNALSPIVGFAELLLQTETNLTSKGSRYLEHIRTAGDDITHIVSRLREFYRRREDTDEGKAVSLNHLASQVLDLTRPRWRDMSYERGISVTIVTNFAPDLPSVVGIESELREALTNLVLNAVDALARDGTISVSTRIAAWAQDDEGLRKPSQAVLEVADTGLGMDEETRKRCLEPFFSTKGVRGTGLGLAMVYGIMERHEGRIEIDSHRGKGTTVRLVFPVREQQSSIGSAPAEPQMPLPRLRILFVDDEPLVRQLVRDMLSNERHDVVLTDGGDAALREFRSAMALGEPFDVVITDLGMPQIDGRRLAQLLKDESPATPVIMLTGWGSFMRADGDTPAHVDGVLSKPPRIAELRQALRRVTQKSAALALS